VGFNPAQGGFPPSAIAGQETKNKKPNSRWRRFPAQEKKAPFQEKKVKAQAPKGWGTGSCVLILSSAG